MTHLEDQFAADRIQATIGIAACAAGTAAFAYVDFVRPDQLPSALFSLLFVRGVIVVLSLFLVLRIQTLEAPDALHWWTFIWLLAVVLLVLLVAAQVPRVDGLSNVRDLLTLLVIYLLLPNRLYLQVFAGAWFSLGMFVVLEGQGEALSFGVLSAHALGHMSGIGLSILIQRLKSTHFVRKAYRTTHDALGLDSDHPLICAWCRKLRIQSDWVSLEQHFPEVHFSHGICPDCFEQHNVDFPTVPFPPDTDQPER